LARLQLFLHANVLLVLLVACDDGRGEETPEPHHSDQHDASAPTRRSVHEDGGDSWRGDDARDASRILEDAAQAASRIDSGENQTAGSELGDLPPEYPCLVGWPMPYPPGSMHPNRTEYVREPAGVVTDTTTGLTWALEVARFHALSDAVAYCQRLDFAGARDWRLPLFTELASLINYSVPNKPFYDEAFLRFDPEPPAIVSNYYFWTSSSNESETWHVSFGGGGYGRSPLTYDTTMLDAALRAMCVRTSREREASPSRCYDVSAKTETMGDKTWPSEIKNHVSRLTWHQPAPNMNFIRARSYCQTYSEPGTWRVPTTAEFSTLLAVPGEPYFDVYDMQSSWLTDPYGSDKALIFLGTIGGSRIVSASTRDDLVSRVLCVKSE
jgi:hypothetical protein